MMLMTLTDNADDDDDGDWWSMMMPVWKWGWLMITKLMIVVDDDARWELTMRLMMDAKDDEYVNGDKN